MVFPQTFLSLYCINRFLGLLIIHQYAITMQDKIVKLKSYDRVDEARLDQQVLTEQNISSSIYDSTSAQILPMLQELGASVVVMVFEKDVEKALKVLSDYHQYDMQL